MEDENQEEIYQGDVCYEDVYEKNAENSQPEPSGKSDRKFFYIAVVCTALGALFFGLTFTPLAVYSLLAAILFCLASLSFLGTQKKRENFKGVLITTIITYVLLGIFLAFLVGGIIFVSVT